MSLVINIPEDKNGPKMHQLLRNSFTHVHAVGMRLAPEILLLEFFREIFFENHYAHEGKEKNINPYDKNKDGEPCYEKNEIAVLHTLRGRRRNFRGKNKESFYAPAYPELVKESGLRKESDRVILYFLLQGPIAQHLWSHGMEHNKSKVAQKNLINLIIDASIGTNSSHSKNDTGGGKADILSAALINNNYDTCNREHVAERIGKKTKAGSIMKGIDDVLAKRIYEDFKYLCMHEKDMPRLQWIKLFMTFLRISTPMWLLAQMQITILLHKLLISTIDGKNSSGGKYSIEKAIKLRNHKLLLASITPGRDIYEHTKTYMKKRIELNILLYMIDSIVDGKDRIENKKLCVQGESSGNLTVEGLVSLAKKIAPSLKSKFIDNFDGSINIQNYLIRMSESYPAWRDPLKKGPGKNIDEFFRVLYKDQIENDGGGHLLSLEGRRRTKGFRVFPGQMLLKTMVFLAAKDKRENSNNDGGGKLVLYDIEKHFEQYGIDVSSSEVRNLIIRELQEIGLLVGSADAGGNVAVSSPWKC